MAFAEFTMSLQLVTVSTALVHHGGEVERRARRHVARALRVAPLAAVLLVAACDSTGGIDTSSPPTSGPTVSSSTPTTASATPSAKAAVVAQYKAYWKLEASSFRYPSSSWPARYAKVATDPLLSNALTNLGKMKVAGEELYGAPVISDVTATINGSMATVRACVDSTKYGRKKASTGKILAVGGAIVGEATLKLGDDGVWRVSRFANPEGPCSGG